MNKTDSRVTVVQVAAAAGVATGTVSRVLNHRTDVNADAKARVLKAVQSLGYQRHRRTGVSRVRPANGKGCVAMVFFGMEDTMVHLPFANQAMQGIESALDGRGVTLMVANVPKGDRIPALLGNGHVQGLILKGPNQGLLPLPEENEFIRSLGRFPFVWLMGRLTNAVGDHCNFDTGAAGRLVADHLYARGHRQVAFFNPKPGQTQFDKVGRAFGECARSHGCDCTVFEASPQGPLIWPLPAITQEERVAELVDRWKAVDRSRRPTAIFVPSDRTAVQLYTILEQYRIKVGRDVSVISCNNERPLIMGLNPSLTTIDVHAEYLGRCAVELLYRRIHSPPDPHDVQMLVEPQLVERTSVANLSPPGPRGRTSPAVPAKSLLTSLERRIATHPIPI